ncbi:MAG TPA: hypothetical protein VL132_21310, partial [Planctomycetaceae bacterium]|nr:hypothetical protein [Planctomycetaceae bacterium]
AEVQREIDRVETAANEAIAKAVRTKTFLLQSPNDADRHHLNINLDVTKTWRISGKIDFFDGAPPREVYGHFDPDSNSCIRLRIGKKWHVGSPPPDVNGFPVN